jgi:hypothetical protein
VTACCHHFGQMLAACGITRRIIAKRFGWRAKLAGDIEQQRIGRHLTRFEHPTGMAQIKQHERAAESGSVGAAAAYECEILGGQRVTPRDLKLVRRRVEQPRPHVITEQPSPYHSPPINRLLSTSSPRSIDKCRSA